MVTCALVALAASPALILALFIGQTSSVTILQTLSLAGLVASSAFGVACLLLRGLHTERKLTQALSALARQEAYFRAVLDTAGDAILTFDDAGRIKSANKAAARLFGYRPAGLRGKLLEKLVPHATFNMETNTHRVFGAATAVEGRRLDGTTFPVAVSISKVRLEGQPLFLAIIHDMSDLAEARRKAEESSRAKTAFLGLMSHELRTPLNAVLWASEVLRGGPLSTEQMRLLSTLTQSAEQLLTSVEQLIDYSRLESGEVRLERRPFGIRRVVEEATAPLASLARSKGVKLQSVIEETVPTEVVGDAQRLHRVLHCLAANAIKFTDSGEACIRASVSQTVPPSLCITVSDTGLGIAPSEQGRIFQPFEQAAPAATGGVGLGLAIASRLASLMGGSITVNSTPGKGASFRLELPLEVPTTAGGQRPVLVVLADAAERANVQEMLHGLGLRTAGAATGKAAMTELMRGLVDGEPFGMVVLEEHMPDADARGWLRQLRSGCDWGGPIVLLHEGEPRFIPEGVTATLDRNGADTPAWAELLGRHYPLA
jgi:PAS domain S-box-containing protein